MPVSAESRGPDAGGRAQLGKCHRAPGKPSASQQTRPSHSLTQSDRMLTTTLTYHRGGRFSVKDKDRKMSAASWSQRKVVQEEQESWGRECQPGDASAKQQPRPREEPPSSETPKHCPALQEQKPRGEPRSDCSLSQPHAGRTLQPSGRPVLGPHSQHCCPRTCLSSTTCGVTCTTVPNFLMRKLKLSSQ